MPIPYCSKIVPDDLAPLVEKYGREPVLAQLHMNAHEYAKWTRRESAKSIRAARKEALKSATRHAPRSFRMRLHTEAATVKHTKRLAEAYKDLGALALIAEG